MKLTFIMNAGDNIVKKYEKRYGKNCRSLKKEPTMCRSDSMLKKMIEQQEKQMAGK